MVSQVHNKLIGQEYNLVQVLLCQIYYVINQYALV